MFAGFASELLDQVCTVAGSPTDVLTATVRTPFAHPVYPATCARIAEVLGLLGLLTALADTEVERLGLPDRATVEQTVHAMLREQPGTAHPIGDSFASGLIAPTLLVAAADPVAAREFLTRAAVWVADRYDDGGGGIGLAPPGATASTEIAQLLGGPYENGPRRRPTSYLATVITDLAAISIPDPSFYSDVLNEFLAVDIVPQLVTADEIHAQWRPDGPRTRLTVRVEYLDPLPADGAAARHFREGRLAIPGWDAMALAGVVRNRHSVAAIREVLEHVTQRGGAVRHRGPAAGPPAEPASRP
jgi:hypothetical protein